MEHTETQNAQIINTMLGVEDHGIFTFYITLDYGGSGQGFGGYALDAWSEKDNKRIGTAFGCDAIMELLRTLEVDKWEDLKGQYVRVRGTYNNAEAIGHLLKDKWFSLDRATT